jgi:hypothetical protein
MDWRAQSRSCPISSIVCRSVGSAAPPVSFVPSIAKRSASSAHTEVSHRRPPAALTWESSDVGVKPVRGVVDGGDLTGGWRQRRLDPGRGAHSTAVDVNKRAAVRHRELVGDTIHAGARDPPEFVWNGAGIGAACEVVCGAAVVADPRRHGSRRDAWRLASAVSWELPAGVGWCGGC